MSNRLDTVTELIAEAIGNAGLDPEALRRYLDLYADLRAEETSVDDLAKAAKLASTAVVYAKPEILDRPPEPARPDEGGQKLESPEPAEEKTEAKSARVQGAFEGAGGTEKKLVYAALVRYMETHGKDAAQVLSDLTGGEVSTQQINRMHEPSPVPIADWRAVGKVLEVKSCENK